MLWRGLLKIELEILQKSRKIATSVFFLGMAKDGRYVHRGPPEIDCISAQIQQAKLLRVRSAVERIALSLTGMKLYARKAGDRPWILKTKGSCSQHPDNKGKGIFSLIVCIATDAPYQMLISSNCRSRGTMFASYELTNFSFMVFPACMYHQCRASKSNRRTIMNVLVSA